MSMISGGLRPALERLESLRCKKELWPAFVRPGLLDGRR